MVATSEEQVASDARLRRFLPLDNGPQAIPALDGLRAIAALSVLVFHGFLIRGIVLGNPRTTVLGLDMTFLWTYLQTGVILFFVLSGFLLFLPFARAILSASPLPSPRGFYQRRALRILPAYWVCLALLVIGALPTYLTKPGIKNILVHIVLIHNLFPLFNRAIEGPFWTLAVEAQFYLLLPIFAWGVARSAGAGKSIGRVLVAVLGLIALSLALREMVALLGRYKPQLHGWRADMLDGALVVINGTQGRFFEVFAVGMLCSVVYIVIFERGALSPKAARLAGWVLVGGSLLLSSVLTQFVLARQEEVVSIFYQSMRPGDIMAICGPLAIGIAYAMLVLGVLLGGDALRWCFVSTPLRFVGLISYSLYLWHLPLLLGALSALPSAWPATLRATAGPALGGVIALPFAYVSYMLVERPLLQRRRRASTTEGAVVPTGHRIPLWQGISHAPD